MKKTMKKTTKKTTFGADMIEGMKLALAHHRGEIELDRVVIPKKPARVRRALSR
jgi:hypothetical protein